jgi:UDP-N-acetylmuramyl pentapeptide phosphotransferase/UDP-N-acetylglucosamine-1-phosphate transferase
MLGVALGLAAGIAIPSLVDDWRGLSTRTRLACHFLAAGVFVALAVAGEPLWLRAVLTVGIVWMSNLYNFMDGADGLAGGMAVFGFSGLALTSYLGDAPLMATLCLCLACSAAAFLLFNFHPARLFLGDAGSVPLGFLAATIGIVGSIQGLWDLWFPLLVFSPFVVDASIVVLLRLLRGERVWVAHREHFYQQLVQLGWGHQRTAIAEYGLMLACGVTAQIGRQLNSSGLIALLTLVAAVYLLLAALVARKWRARQSEVRT